jgi:hypothetical protein
MATVTLKDRDDIVLIFPFVCGKAETTSYHLPFCDNTTMPMVDQMYDALSSDDITTIQTAICAPRKSNMVTLTKDDMRCLKEG